MSRPNGIRVKADASPTRPYRRGEVAMYWLLAVSGWETSGRDVIASLPQRGEGEVGSEPGPGGEGEENGDGEGEEERGEAEDDDPEGAEGVGS